MKRKKIREALVALMLDVLTTTPHQRFISISGIFRSVAASRRLRFKLSEWRRWSFGLKCPRCVDNVISSAAFEPEGLRKPPRQSLSVVRAAKRACMGWQDSRPSHQVRTDQVGSELAVPWWLSVSVSWWYCWRWTPSQVRWFSGRLIWKQTRQLHRLLTRARPGIWATFARPGGGGGVRMTARQISKSKKDSEKR